MDWNRFGVAVVGVLICLILALGLVGTLYLMILLLGEKVFAIIFSALFLALMVFIFYIGLE